AELDYCIYPGISDDITHEEMLRGLLESLNHVKDVIINDFWWEHGGTVSGIKASCVKEVDRIEKQFDDSTPNLLFGLVNKEKCWKGTLVVMSWYIFKAKMYSLKLGRWKDINDVPHIPSWCHGTFSNGAFHWMVSDTPMSYHHHRLTNIVSLDLANETYGEVSPPPLYGENVMGVFR
ncbi:hypothetical protein Tco_0712851, partial [Tanacetum coccineum]